MIHFQTPFKYSFTSTYLDIIGQFYTLEKVRSRERKKGAAHAPFLRDDSLERSHKRLRSLGRIKLHARLHNIQRVER